MSESLIRRQRDDAWAALERVTAERNEARRERDFAIAHDRHTYPTADAYERACAAMHEHRQQAERYRLAWKSARRRAERLNQEANVLNDLLRDHEVLHAERVERVMSLMVERGEARQDAVTNGQAAERLSGELAEARRTIQLLRAALDDRPLDGEGFDRLRAALTDAQVEERIEKIRQTAAERIEARRLRAALDEERIEPEPVCFNCGEPIWKGLIWVHRANEDAECVGGGYATPGRTEGEAG